MATIQQELSRGWQIHQNKQLPQAEAIYRNVIRQAPQNANAWCYLGIALHDQRRYPEAVEAYRQALAAEPAFPIALNNLGNTLRYVAQFDESDACFQKAIDLKPDYLNAYKNRGTLHVWTGQLDKGLHYYEQALRINPNEAELHRNLGVIYLLKGDFARGWAEYRWRWLVGDLHRPRISARVWDGSNLAGKSILLTAEQGLGDTLNFVRFASVLREQGADTTVYCQPTLVALLQNAPELGSIYPNSLAVDREYDFQCSLLDVADLTQVDMDTIPAGNPYLLPATNLAAFWNQQFPSQTQLTRVGIAWQGNPDHQADAFRSIPLSSFECLADVPSVELVSLQSGFGTEQISGWKAARPLKLLDPNVDKSSGAFMDTAAIMKTLDLIITSDTSIAHLAGALGVPTWIALSYMPDWRWLMDRDTSPWYPTVKLFRQANINEWQPVFEQIRTELTQFSQK